MSFSADDLGAIKWGLLSCALSAGIAFALVDYSSASQRQASNQLQQAQRQLNEARGQLLVSQNDQENMSSYQLEYDALVSQKIIGAEPRLDWIENLEHIRKQGLLPDFRYSISPQTAYAPNPPLNAGNFVLNFSPMTLQFDLLHEDQLMRFFKAMRNQVPGWFMLEKCDISRAKDMQNKGVMLKAECAGGWFTMKNRNMP
jgi:hypothetical protein